MAPVMKYDLRLRTGDVIAVSLLALAVLVPSETWVRWLRDPPADLLDGLVLGAGLFRISLVALAVWCVAADRLGWWRGTPHGGPTTFDLLRDRTLLGLLAAATLLRLYRLDIGPWQDEILAWVDYARAPYGVILTTFTTQNQHFLYSLLAHTSFLVFGESTWALRLPAVLFGVGSLAALYLFGRCVTTRRESLLAIALLAFSYQHVWFSQNARGYTGLLFWALLGSWLFLRALDGGQPRSWVLYGLTCALGTYTNQTMLFVCAGQFLIYLALLAARRGRESSPGWTPVFSAYVLAGLLTIALHSFALTQILGPALADLSPVDTWKDPLWALREAQHGLGLGARGGMAALAAAIVALVGGLSYLRERSLLPWLLLLPVALTAASTIGFRHPVWPRLFFFALGFAALIAVRGILVVTTWLASHVGLGSRACRMVGACAVVLAIVLSASSLRHVYRPKQDYQGALDYVESSRQPADAVAVIGIAAYPYRSLYRVDWELLSSVEQLSAMRAAHRRTWVVYSFPLYVDAAYPELMEAVRGQLTPVRTFEGSLAGGAVHVYVD